jgi:hypothetical protein
VPLGASRASRSDALAALSVAAGAWAPLSAAAGAAVSAAAGAAVSAAAAALSGAADGVPSAGTEPWEGVVPSADFVRSGGAVLVTASTIVRERFEGAPR